MGNGVDGVGLLTVPLVESMEEAVMGRCRAVV